MEVLRTLGYVLIAITGLCAVATILALIGLIGAILGAIALGTAIVYVVSIGVRMYCRKPSEPADT